MRRARPFAAALLATLLGALGTLAAPAGAGAQDEPGAAAAPAAAAARAQTDPRAGAPGAAQTATPAAAETAAQAATQAGGEEAAVPSPEELGVFVDTLEVNVVNVEVFVTDKKGNRVTGLGRDDFEVREDGRPVAITNFYAVEARRPVAEVPLPTAPESAPEPLVPGAAEPAPTLPEDQQLHLVVYVDNFNIDPINRNRMLRELRLFLADQVRVGDQVMLVSYDRSLHVRRNFTSDPQLIASALTELETMTGFARQRESDRRERLSRIQDAESDSEALLWARGWADEVNNDLRFTLDALKEMVGSLAGLPGRKAILYVSDGVPMVPAEDLFHAVQEKFRVTTAITESFSYSMTRQFTELAAQANANRVTFYTLDAAGLRVSSDFSAENKNVPISGVDSVHTNNLQAPLRYVANATGGIAILNTNRAAPLLERVAEDFNTYYSLGYRALEPGRGRYHEIDVKVKNGKGLVVRHRDGYREKTVESRMSDATMSALHFPFERNPLGVELGFLAATPREDRHFVVPVQVRVPIGKIVLVPHGATREGRVRLFIAAIDEEGRTAPVQQLAVPISIPEGELERALLQSYQYTASLLMRGGAQVVAVGVRDELGGTESFATGRVRVGG
jgi:VWFA-related protein